MSKTIRFAPYNVGRWLVWGLTAILFAVMPLIFTKGFAITLLSQMGIMIIFALSYNMIFGQGGMLSFGHAVYSGLGAFFAIHALNWVGDGRIWIPVSLIPLVGGLFGAIFGVIFGYVTTKKAGTPFAMITLGIGEMVFSASLMFPGFFGGEGGISSNRVIGDPFLGVSFGPAIEVYYLIAVWCFVCMIAMFAFSQTPLGRISNAVRDNPERAEFIGYNTQRVRFLVLVVSAFFAGISGGLAAISFEIVTAENVSALRSGGVLLATFIGGAMFFFGPVLGAVIFVFFAIALSDYTKAWQFYLGVFFVLMVMYAPGGVASLILMNLRVAKYQLFNRLWKPYGWLLAASAVLLVGVIMVIEMSYHLTLNFASGTQMKLFGFQVDAASLGVWAIAAAIVIAGALFFNATRKTFAREWGNVQARIEDQIQRGVRA
ncbi:branched-chain amino acid ABC transporter permease [Zeimonas arvi]|uniref:Branched-chain amino acid ABC transporter permease n=1 Tax=Zeimonas arvi TaxID=2498847 RepID=A0A5C8P0J1_9BURK|nr:branched-chain amino acid ABC transporter permease [Zeimonas arvi]TXL67105.1 branched-chain amino acid ABC transporter permease [Zeimonas arvi]